MPLRNIVGQTWHPSDFLGLANLCMHQNVGCHCIENLQPVPELNCAESSGLTKPLNEGMPEQPAEYSNAYLRIPARPGFREYCEERCYCKRVSPKKAKSLRRLMQEGDGLGRLAPGMVRESVDLDSTSEEDDSDDLVIEYDGPDDPPDPSDPNAPSDQNEWASPAHFTPRPNEWLPWRVRTPGDPLASPSHFTDSTDSDTTPAPWWPAEQTPNNAPARGILDLPPSPGGQNPSVNQRPGSLPSPNRDTSCPRSTCWRANMCSRNGGRGCACIVPPRQIGQLPPSRGPRIPPPTRFTRLTAACGGLRMAGFRRALSPGSPPNDTNPVRPGPASPAVPISNLTPEFPPLQAGQPIPPPAPGNAASAPRPPPVNPQAGTGAANAPLPPANTPASKPPGNPPPPNNPPPPPKQPSLQPPTPDIGPCNCSYVSAACLSPAAMAANGMIYEPAANQVGVIAPETGMCCDLRTGDMRQLEAGKVLAEGQTFCV